MKKLKRVIAIFSCALLVVSCGKDKNSETIEGLRPVYASQDELTRIDVSSGAMLENPGKIYVYNDYLLVNDVAKGIHIYDYSQIENPQEIAFIAIGGNMGFSVKDGVIYADNYTDMVVIDISQPHAPVLKNRVAGVFPVQQYPDESGPFECADPSKGPVVAWERALLTNPKCFN